MSNTSFITLEKNTIRYTSSTSKVARKMRGELAQAGVDLREHKRIPKFDVANLKFKRYTD